MIYLRNIKITIEYDGTRYSGWQKQKNAEGIQDMVTNAIRQVTGETVKLNASGRTDAGVHALGQTATFNLEANIPVKSIPKAINTYLPKDIVILKAEVVDNEFHARYSAKGKKYMYIINNSEYRSALNYSKEYYFPKQLDYKKMKKAAEYFIGTYDFKGFMSSGSSVKDTVRTISKIQLKRREDDRIVMNIVGNGFLYNMVRIIAGTLVDVGLGKIEPSEIRDIIKSKDRTRAGKTLPAQGLYLVEVYY